MESEQIGEDLEAMESFEVVPKTMVKENWWTQCILTFKGLPETEEEKNNNNPCKRLLSKIGNRGASVKIPLHLKN